MDKSKYDKWIIYSFIVFTILTCIIFNTTVKSKFTETYNDMTTQIDKLNEDIKNLEELNQELNSKLLEYQISINKLQQEQHNKEIESIKSQHEMELEELENKYKSEQKKETVSSRGSTIKKSKTFTATAYDLSVQSCGKKIGSKGYGITANGTNLSGKTREQAMTVAVDPKIIKLGTKLKITFPKPYEHFNGIYTANDTGGGIKGNKVDIFMGDFNNNKTHQSVWDFGVRKVTVEILR